MPQEIERKFLVRGDFKAYACQSFRIVQGYLSSVPERTVRIRVKGEQGYLTVKGKSDVHGVTRYEWEKEIPLSEAEEAALRAMYGLPADGFGTLRPAIVDAGLPDIMLPLASPALLAALQPDMSAISALSKRLHVTGVHAFARTADAVHCRNFAPLYGIDEESATGTSNGALTYYLFRRGLVVPGEINLFIQGESMGKPSKIYSRLTAGEGGAVFIRVGGSAVVRA